MRKKVLPKYLFYQVNSEEFWPRLGTGQPFIKKRDALRKQVVLPSFSEQKRVVNLLDTADNIRKKRQEADHLSNRIIESTFSIMFNEYLNSTREIIHLGEVIEKNVL